MKYQYQDDYFKLPKFYLTLSGSWGLETKHWKHPSLSWIARTSHNIYRYFSIYLLTQLAIQMSIATYFNIDKGFDDAFLAFLNAIIYMWNCFCFWFQYFKQAAIDDFFTEMNKKLRRRSAPGLTYVSIEPGLARAKRVLNTWHYITFAAAFSYNFVPLINRQKVLPLPAWYPFDVYVSSFVFKKVMLKTMTP